MKIMTLKVNCDRIFSLDLIPPTEWLFKVCLPTQLHNVDIYKTIFCDLNKPFPASTSPLRPFSFMRQLQPTRRFAPLGSLSSYIERALVEYNVKYNQSFIRSLWCLCTEEAGALASLTGTFRVEGTAKIKNNGKIKLRLTLIV